MEFDVHLTMKEKTTDAGMDVSLQVNVDLAPSGLYIASCPMQSPLTAAGKTPRSAILEYLEYLSWYQTVEAEGVDR